MASLKPRRIRPIDGQCRDVVQRGLYGQERVGKASLADGGSIAHSSQLFQRNHGLPAQRPDGLAPESGNMAKTAQNPPHIAGERPDIGAFAAFRLEFGVVGVRDVNDPQ